MNLPKKLHITSYLALLAVALTTPLVGCSGEGDDSGGSGGTESGGTSGGSDSGGANTGGTSGGSDTGGASSGGGDVGTGGQTGGVIFGDPCTDSNECPMRGEFAGNCKTNWPGGYCSATCNRAPDCGPGNVCDTGLRSCLKACEDQSDCREGYVCSEEFGGCEPAL